MQGTWKPQSVAMGTRTEEECSSKLEPKEGKSRLLRPRLAIACAKQVYIDDRDSARDGAAPQSSGRSVPRDSEERAQVDSSLTMMSRARQCVDATPSFVASGSRVSCNDNGRVRRMWRALSSKRMPRKVPPERLGRKIDRGMKGGEQMRR